MGYKTKISCVYIIRFESYHRIYIGSTDNFKRREGEHLNKLKLNKHHNKFIQRAYNKYNLESEIKIEILEIIENSEILLSKEQYWIDYYNAANPKYGFNNIKDVTSRGTKGYKFSKRTKTRMSLMKIGKSGTGKNKSGPNHYNCKEFEFYDPKGNLLRIKNLKFFCKENDLKYQSMLAVAHGFMIEYNGWKKHLDRKNERIASALVLSPEGIIFEVHNLRRFAKTHNLEERSFAALCEGRSKTCCGWKNAKDTEEKDFYVNQGRNRELIAPNGKITQTKNLYHFCKENGLSYDSLRKGCNSKGWKIKK